MTDDNPQYRLMITACDNLMKNSKLSLYEEVEILKGKALKAESNVGVLTQLTSDLSFLIERLSGPEKRTYLSCCENQEATSLWASTEP
jgi:hypothetical protein